MQQLNPSEISDIVKGHIQGLDVTAEAQSEGTIVGVSDGIAHLARMRNCEMTNSMDHHGMALNLERDSVGVVVLGL